jgi:histidinol-phosphate aminotransferase
MPVSPNSTNTESPALTPKAWPTCTILPKPLVLEMSTYSPPLEGRRTKTRLDFNENTQGYAETLPYALPNTLLTVYPEYQTLLETLAATYDLPVESLLLCNGSDEALHVIPQTFLQPDVDTALVCSPTFPMIPHNLRLSGAKLLTVSMTPELDYDLSAIEAALTSHPVKLAIFASPDNPTGAVLPKTILSHWCERFPNTLFVLDEAYSEYMGPDFSALPEVLRHPNLMVTRSFSKAWGLAGLRLGFVAAHPQLVAYLARVRSPYSVNQMAVEAGTGLLAQKTQVFADAQATVERRAQLIEELQQRGLTVRAGGGNFFLLKLGPLSKLYEQFLAASDLLVRDRSGHPFLVGTVRISSGAAEENQRLLELTDSFLRHYALAFDLDDTLVDTSKSFDAVVNFLILKWSDMPLGQRELALLREEGGFNDDWCATQELLRRRGVQKSYEAIETEGQKLYLKLAPEVETLLVPEDLLKQLSQRYRLFIFTGRKRLEYEAIWQERLEPYFEAVFCSDDCPNLAPKPSGDYLTELRQRFQLAGGVYFGNSVDDMRAAREAGFMPMGVLTTASVSKLQEAGAVRTALAVQDYFQV